MKFSLSSTLAAFRAPVVLIILGLLAACAPAPVEQTTSVTEAPAAQALAGCLPKKPAWTLSASVA